MAEFLTMNYAQKDNNNFHVLMPSILSKLDSFYWCKLHGGLCDELSWSFHPGKALKSHNCNSLLAVGKYQEHEPCLRMAHTLWKTGS